MKCRVCGQPANINLRAYHTALCAPDFIDFLENRVDDTIRKYRLIEKGDVPVVAVSGGKDSLSVWHMLNRFAYGADGIYVDLGIDGYSQRSLEKIYRMADLLGRRVHVFHLNDLFGRGVGPLSRSMRRKPCSLCGTLKRYVMNRICMEKGFTVVVTGHNLDDEASALFGNLLYWKKEYLWKKDLVLDAREGHLSKKVKPLFLCSEREVAAYAIINHIDYIYEECPFSAHAKSLVYKQILNGLEEQSPGTKIRFVKGYLDILKVKRDEPLEDGCFCPTCGYPTQGDACAVCNMMSRFGITEQIRFEEYPGSPGVF
jgi:uncharacterized protein (TIGR00269 family)